LYQSNCASDGVCCGSLSVPFYAPKPPAPSFRAPDGFSFGNKDLVIGFGGWNALGLFTAVSASMSDLVVEFLVNRFVASTDETRMSYLADIWVYPCLL
jgi:hypothetical protein